MRHPTNMRDRGCHRERLRVATLAAAGTASVLILVLGAAGTNHPLAVRDRGSVLSTTAVARTRTAPPDGGATAPVPAGLFVGTWHVHTILMVISSDANGTVTWPTHNRCDIGVTGPSTACDRLVPVDGGEQIVDGGHAQIHLTGVVGARAQATVEGSTDPSLLADGVVTLTVAPDDVLTVSSSAGQLALCGPQASGLTVQQQDAEGINCGA